MKEEKVTVQGQESDEERSGIVDFMMFCCLVLNTYTLWMLPTTAIFNGGGYFLLMFIIASTLFVFPMIHLEIFIGQRHQSGICKTFRSYGWAFEGFGVVILIITFLVSLRDIGYSYMIIKHIKQIFTNITDVVSCTSPRYTGVICTSLYDDDQCKRLYGPTSHYALNRCLNTSRVLRVPSSSEYYFNWYINGPIKQDFDIPQMFFYFTVFTVYACISMVGERIIKLIMATIYGLFLFFLVLGVTRFLWTVEMNTIMHIFWTTTTPEALLSYKAYAKVLHVALRSGGVMICGIMSASSFRTKNANTHGFAFAIVLNNIFISVLSYAFTIGISAYLKIKLYSGYDHTPRKSVYRYYLGTATDAVLSNTGDYIWVFIILIPSTIARLVRFFPPIIMMYGIARDCKRHQWSLSIVGTTSTCIAAFLIASSECYQPRPYYLNILINSLQAHYDTISVALTVIVFLHVYGNREYLVDLNELYPEDDNRSIIEPTSSIYFAIYKFLPFLFGFFGLMETSRSVQTVGIYDLILHLLPILVFLVYLFNNISTLQERDELSMLFSVTPEHPSYDRISGSGLFEIENQIKPKPTEKSVGVKSVPKKAEGTELQKVPNVQQSLISTKPPVQTNEKQIPQVATTTPQQSLLSTKPPVQTNEKQIPQATTTAPQQPLISTKPPVQTNEKQIPQATTTAPQQSKELKQQKQEKTENTITSITRTLLARDDPMKSAKK